MSELGREILALVFVVLLFLILIGVLLFWLGGIVVLGIYLSCILICFLHLPKTDQISKQPDSQPISNKAGKVIYIKLLRNKDDK